MWSIARSIRSVVLDVLCNGKINRILELENLLKKHRLIYLNPSNLPAKSSDDRHAVENATTTPINLPDLSHKFSVTPDLIDEAISFSDAFDLNELIVVELLLTDVLITLLQSRSGRMWSSVVGAEVEDFVTQYTKALWDDGLMKNILASLRKFDVNLEFNRLETCHILGDSKHRHDVFMLLRNIADSLSECILLWSSQTSLTVNESMIILDFMFDFASNNKEQSDQVNLNNNVNQPLEHYHGHLLMSVLYCFQPFSLGTISADQLSDLSSIDLSHPLFSDPRFAINFGRLLDDLQLRCDNRECTISSMFINMLALIRLAWAVCLRRTNNVRVELRRRHQLSPPTNNQANNASLSVNDDEFGIGGDDDDELQAASAIEMGALEFARKELLAIKYFEREPLWVYRLHCILTDLIVCMPVRIREIRLRDEDLCRTTNYNPSVNGFANLLLLIAQLYNHPGSQFHARLSLEYWWPAGEMTSTAMMHNEMSFRSRNLEMEHMRQAALFRFVRSTGDMISSPYLFLPYLYMLHGLVGSRSAAHLCFTLLKNNNATNARRFDSVISWDHFFASFHRYLEHMKQQNVAHHQQMATSAVSHQIYPHIYGIQHMSHQQGDRVTSQQSWSSKPSGHVSGMSDGHVQAMSSTTASRMIQPEEQAGLQGVLRLISRICRVDPVSRAAFVSNTNWQLIQCCLGFLTCSVSIELKADFLRLLTSLARSQHIACLLWRHLHHAELLPFSSRPNQQGLHTDMNDVEPRAEQFSLTRSFVSFITILIPRLTIHSPALGAKGIAGPMMDGPPVSSAVSLTNANAIVSIVSFVTSTIFLRHTMRAYRDPNERWEIAASCLILFDGLIHEFVKRLRSAMTFVLNSLNQSPTKQDESATVPSSTAEDEPMRPYALDWAGQLLIILHELGGQQQPKQDQQSDTQHRRPVSTAEQLISQLNLPSGWPHSDPGYYLASQLLTDSSLFRMITGLLEVGLHRHLQFPIPNGPPVGMTRATLAGLNVICRMLANEEMLVSFVRRMTTSIFPNFSMPQSSKGGDSNICVPLPSLPSSGIAILPVCLSRLLMSINSGSGRADLIPTLLKFCLLSDYLPDHASCVIQILGYLVDAIKPHSELLVLLTSDPDTRRQLLAMNASLLKWPTLSSGQISWFDSTSSSILPANYIDTDGSFNFNDQWLYGLKRSSTDGLVSSETDDYTDADDDTADGNTDNFQFCILGFSSVRVGPPAGLAKVVKLDGAFPCQHANWQFPVHDWEHWAVWLAEDVTTNCILIARADWLLSRPLTSCVYQTVTAGTWLYKTITGQDSIPHVLLFLHVLLAAIEQPTLNLTHWLCGFNIDSCKTISWTNLQDAGIGNVAQTCLHAVLDLVDTASRLFQSNVQLTMPMAIGLQWSLALIWQLLYRLAANPSTSLSLLRFLRSSHDLLAQHIQMDLCYRSTVGGEVTGDSKATDKQNKILQALWFNQKNWLLRILAIEIRSSANANQRSYVAHLIKLFFGDLLFDKPLLGTPETNTMSSMSTAFLQCINAVELTSKFEMDKLKTLDIELVEETLAKSELGCCLLNPNYPNSYSSTRLINTHAFLIRLYMKLASDESVHQHSSLSNSIWLFLTNRNASSLSLANRDLIADIQCIQQWIESRNIEAIQLNIGQHAALESWRQVVEISLGLLTSSVELGSQRFICGTTNNESYQRMSVMNYSDLIMTVPQAVDVSSFSGQIIKQPRPFVIVCLDLLILTLAEFTTSPQTAQSISLLASGTCLTLSFIIFKQTQGLWVSSSLASLKQHHHVSDSVLSNMLAWIYNTKQWISLLVCASDLLIQAIVNTKSSAQRIRANLYGGLCFLIRFYVNLNRLFTDDSLANDAAAPPSNIGLFPPSSDLIDWFSIFHLESASTKDIDASQSLLCVLVTDLFYGHIVTQMSAVSLLDYIISFDRCTVATINYLEQQGLIEHYLETLHEDLKVIAGHLAMTARNQTIDEITAESALSVFYLYQSKITLFCRIGSSKTGAKLLANHDLLQRLTSSRIFSLSNLSNCFADGLDSMIICPTPNSDDLRWFANSVFMRNLTVWSRSEDESIYHNLIQKLLVGDQLTNSYPSDDIDDYGTESGISWPNVLFPTLSLCKIMLNSLGPTHISIGQQTFKFFHTHSLALLSLQPDLGHVIQIYLSRKDWSISPTQPLRCWWLTQWLACHISLINLLGHLMHICASIAQLDAKPSGDDEFCNIQREVVQMKIVKHTVDLLPTLFQAQFTESIYSNLTTNNNNNEAKCLTTRMAFERLLVQSQRVELIRHCLVILSANVVQSDLVSQKKAFVDKYRSKNDDGGVGTFSIGSKWVTAFQSVSLSGSNDDNNDSSDNRVQDGPSEVNAIMKGMELFVQLIGWSLAEIKSIEHLCLSLVDCQFLMATSSQTEQNQQFGRAVAQFLNSDLPNENIPIGDLRQAASVMYDCPVELMFVNRGVECTTMNGQSGDVHILKRLTRIGVSLIRIRLRSLITICEQSSHLVWKLLTELGSCFNRHMAHLLDDNDLGHPVQRSAIRNLSVSGIMSPPPNLIYRRPFNKPNQVSGQTKVLALEKVQQMISVDWLLALKQLTATAYVESNQRLFLQVMSGRLERLALSIHQDNSS